jgi:NlpC/P60 family protein/dipeptidyl peptidase-like protein
MTHARLIPCNRRVALKGWSGQADRYVDGEMRQVVPSVADLLRKPGGALDCQLLFGAEFLVLEDRDGWSFGQAVRDGYVGYVRSDQLQQTMAVSHKITALASHVYSAADMKSGAVKTLPFGARLGGQIDGDFLGLTDGGFVPAQHIKPIGEIEPDFVAGFNSFLGIPYLWGGNSVWGMDCSGALQLVLHAAGLDCPRDTDMQVLELGNRLADDAPLKRGDLIFWQRHVGVMLDPETLIHANAHHMAVAAEPLDGAITRIERAGDGPVTARKRL